MKIYGTGFKLPSLSAKQRGKSVSKALLEEMNHSVFSLTKVFSDLFVECGSGGSLSSFHPKKRVISRGGIPF